MASVFPEFETRKDWIERLQAERKRQVEKGYTTDHDQKHGIKHLLDWALEYIRIGKKVEAGAVVLAALELKEPDNSVKPSELPRYTLVRAKDDLMFVRFNENYWVEVIDDYDGGLWYSDEDADKFLGPYTILSYPVKVTS